MTVKTSTIILVLFYALCGLQGGLGYKIIVSGGKNTCEGVVQLLVESNDKQASVLTACSREFGKEEVHVLCSQLGCAQGQRVHQSRFEFNMTDKVATAIFSYQCAGMEHSLSECRIGSSLCNVLNNNGGDIVAVSCHQETGSPSMTNSALVNSLEPTVLYILLLFTIIIL